MSEETIPQMRERIDGLQGEVKTANERAEAAEKKARLFEARDAFREQGYNPKHAELFVAQNASGDITAEQVTGFADEFGLSPVSVNSESSGAEESGSEETAASTDALAGMGRAASPPGTGGQENAGTERLSHQEWQELNEKNPSSAKEALRQGRVDTLPGNYYEQVLDRRR